MRRDYFTLTIDGASGPEAERPLVTVSYDGPTDQLTARLSKDGSVREAGEIDVAYRLQDSLDESEPTGVVAIADRVTGEYVFELNATADEVFAFVDDAREFGNTSDSEDRYRIVVETADGRLAAYDKSTLLVYDVDGTLLRSQSLIPSGVEI